MFVHVPVCICIFCLVQPPSLECLLMEIYGKVMEPSSKTSSNTNTICHADIKDFPCKATHEVKGYMKQHWKMSLQC